MVTPNYYPIIAGAELFIKNVAERLSDDGDQIAVATRRVKGRTNNETINGVEVFRSSPKSIWDFKSANKNIWVAASTPFITRLVKKLQKGKRFDIIHGHGAIGNSIAVKIARKYGTKAITTVQGGDLADYKETTDNSIMVRIIRKSLSKSDLVHGVSRYTIARARELGAKRTVLIPNGVDTSFFRPDCGGEGLRSELGLEDKSVIVTVSRLTPKNAVDYLIKGFKTVAAENKDAHLVIVGGGVEDNNLLSITKKLDLIDKVTFAGDVPHEDIPKYMDLADVFIRPSLQEGFGIVFIEAMATGTATIGTTVGGITDIITDGKDGLLIPPRKAEAIASSIGSLLSDDKKREGLARAGLRTVKERFEWGQICKRMRNEYSRLIENQ